MSHRKCSLTQAPELVQNLSCPVLNCLSRVGWLRKDCAWGVCHSQQECGLSSSGAVSSEKQISGWAGLWGVAQKTGMGNGQAEETPFWSCRGDRQPWQPLLLPSFWRRPCHPQMDLRSGGKFWGDVKLKYERLENLLHRACICSWLFNITGVTFEHSFGMFFPCIYIGIKEVWGCLDTSVPRDHCVFN